MKVSDWNMKLPLKPYDTENQYLTTLFNKSIRYFIYIWPNSKLNNFRMRKFCFEGICLKTPILKALSWFIYFMSSKRQFLLFTQQNIFSDFFMIKTCFYFVQLNEYLHLNMHVSIKIKIFSLLWKCTKTRNLINPPPAESFSV